MDPSRFEGCRLVEDVPHEIDELAVQDGRLAFRLADVHVVHVLDLESI
jgi:hypothetical protein